MSPHRATVMSRAVGGITRRCRELRNTLEWSAVHALRNEAPWSRNRWGQRYQAVSLSEYHYLRDGNPEWKESALIERVLRPGMTVIDVGANHGMFSLEAAHLVGTEGTVHAFEPTPSTCALLLNNLAVNGLSGVRVFPMALGGADGTARLRVHRELSGLNTLADHDITWNRRVLLADEVIAVPMTTLDAHAEAERLGMIHFLKVDVEGFEMDVLRGARNLLLERRVERILLEVGDLTCANAGVDPDEIIVQLERLGYVLHAPTPNGAVGPRVLGFPRTPFSANFLAMPND